MKKTIFALLIMAAAIIACAAPTPQDPASAPAPPPIAAGSNSTEDMQRAEPALIAASHGRAERTGDDLVLRFANGHSRTFHNDDKGCPDGGPDHCDSFVLIGDLPAFHWFILFEALYEGGRFQLFDERDGLPTAIPYWPSFSPDGERMLIQNDDASGFFEGDALEIWRRDGYRMKREWIANPDEADTGVRTDSILHTKLLSWAKDLITLEFRVDSNFDTRTRQLTPERLWIGTIARGAQGWSLNVRAPKP